jgi:hypothetical protein
MWVMERAVYIQGSFMLKGGVFDWKPYTYETYGGISLLFSLFFSVYEDIFRFYFCLLTVWEATSILGTPTMAAQMTRRMNGYVVIRTYPSFGGT